MVGMPAVYVCGLVAYDGTDYRGFQYQPRVSTIQGTLEEALSKVATLESRVVGSGRTDTGVHASGQVISVLVRWRHGMDSLVNAWNAYLPPSICLLRLALAPEEFQPRFSAIWRTYRYHVHHYDVPGDVFVPSRSPLADRFSAYEKRALDLDSMGRAAEVLLGEHDFTTFGLPTQGTATVRRVRQAQWEVVERSVPDLGEYSQQKTGVHNYCQRFSAQDGTQACGHFVGGGTW